jgi:hypothetical protein
VTQRENPIFFFNESLIHPDQAFFCAGTPLPHEPRFLVNAGSPGVARLRRAGDGVADA